MTKEDFRDYFAPKRSPDEFTIDQNGLFIKEEYLQPEKQDELPLADKGRIFGIYGGGHYVRYQNDDIESQEKLIFERFGEDAFNYLLTLPAGEDDFPETTYSPFFSSDSGKGKDVGRGGGNALCLANTTIIDGHYNKGEIAAKWFPFDAVFYKRSTGEEKRITFAIFVVGRNVLNSVNGQVLTDYGLRFLDHILDQLDAQQSDQIQTETQLDAAPGSAPALSEAEIAAEHAKIDQYCGQSLDEAAVQTLKEYNE